MIFNSKWFIKNIIGMSEELGIDTLTEGVETAKQFEKLKNRRKGILLSGGMDSAIIASFMPGCDAYTFRFLNGAFQKEELNRAEMFAEYYHLTLHYVDINFDIVVCEINIIVIFNWVKFVI